jgi:hypothetical protein
MINLTWPNPPPAANPAITLVVDSLPHWRGVAEAGRWATMHTLSTFDIAPHNCT